MGAMDKSDVDVLEDVAQGGTMEFDRWPGMLERLLDRVDHIARNEFPIPPIPISNPLAPTTSNERPQPVPAPSDRTSSSQDTVSQTSQNTNKENAPPGSPPVRPPVPPFSSTASSAATDTTTTNASIAAPDGTLPPQLLSILNSIRTTLTTNFAVAPPHTIQRLAELILRPRTHYRSLASYLRALDRVVSVSSGADLFPLPTVSMPDASSEGGTTLLNGASGALGSDESLGGALLTPIPWLRNEQHGEVRIESTETVEGPNGVGSIETVSVSVRGIPSTTSSAATTVQVQEQTMRDAGAVTQGELLRQEQEAGVVPVAQSHVGRQTRSATARGLAEEGGSGGASAKAADDEEHPHARGPEEVGMEDMGPQERTGGKAGFDVEAALGRTVSHKGTERHEAEGEKDDGHEAEMKDAEKTDIEPEVPIKPPGTTTPDAADDAGTVMVDADGKAENESVDT